MPRLDGWPGYQAAQKKTANNIVSFLRNTTDRVLEALQGNDALALNAA